MTENRVDKAEWSTDIRSNMSEQLETHLGDNTGQYSRELSQSSSEGLSVTPLLSPASPRLGHDAVAWEEEICFKPCLDLAGNLNLVNEKHYTDLCLQRQRGDFF